MILFLEEVHEQLRTLPGQDDMHVDSVRDQAEAWAKRAMGANWDDEWTPGTVPADVKSAALARAHGLFDHDKDFLDVAEALIEPWRDHTLK